VLLLGALIINNQLTMISSYFNHSEVRALQHEKLETIRPVEEQSHTNVDTKSDWSLTSNDILRKIPDTHFSLQLAALADEQSMLNFFAKHPQLQGKTYQYHRTTTKRSQYVILLGSFESYKMAKVASKTLTTQFPDIDPWIKDYRTIQQDIQ